MQMQSHGNTESQLHPGSYTGARALTQELSVCLGQASGEPQRRCARRIMRPQRTASAGTEMTGSAAFPADPDWAKRASLLVEVARLLLISSNVVVRPSLPTHPQIPIPVPWGCRDRRTQRPDFLVALAPPRARSRRLVSGGRQVPGCRQPNPVLGRKSAVSEKQLSALPACFADARQQHPLQASFTADRQHLEPELFLHEQSLASSSACRSGALPVG